MTTNLIKHQCISSGNSPGVQWWLFVIIAAVVIVAVLAVIYFVTTKRQGKEQFVCNQFSSNICSRHDTSLCFSGRAEVNRGQVGENIILKLIRIII